MTHEEKDREFAGLLEEMDELDQCSFLLDQGLKIPEPKDIMTPENRITGCQVNIWVQGQGHELRMYSDSLLVNGVLAMLAQVNGAGDAPPEPGFHFSLIDRLLPDVIHEDIIKNGIRKVRAILTGEQRGGTSGA